MPGRQSTGPPTSNKSRPRNKAQKRILNALSIAEYEVPARAKIRKSRLGEIEPDNAPKRRRDDSDEASKEDDGSSKHKKPRRGDKDKFGEEIEGGSDSDGNEWMTGQVDRDDDSSLESDDAFGESDEEKFERFAFGGSTGMKSTKKRRSTRDATLDDYGSQNGMGDGIDLNEGQDESELMSTGDESEGFAAEAVDMADILDQRDSASEDEDDVDDSASEGAISELSDSDIEDEARDESKLAVLQDLVAALGNGSRRSTTRDAASAAQESAIPSEYGIETRQKLTIADILPTLTDPKVRKSLRAIADDSKGSAKARNGMPQKLAVPLAKREQDRMDRAVAYEKSRETLNRWIDTVKQNRRADHLHFPLHNPDAASAKDTRRLVPATDVKPLTDLESTIQSILVESGLAPTNEKSQDDKIQAFEELETNKMPMEEVQARRAELRRARELLFREEIKSKRIKKIKSKSYRRVHRKERERNAFRDQEALAEAGIGPSEDEQERMQRQRAEERMGARHRESKWAKSVKGTGRAAWDEDARTGVTEMARREEELKRRIHGKDIRHEESIGSETDSSDDVASDDENEGRFAARMRNKLSKLQSDNEKPQTALPSLKFMQKADAARKARNDEDIERMRRELADEDLPAENSDTEAPGRRTYGPVPKVALSNGNRNEFEERRDSDDDEDRQIVSGSENQKSLPNGDSNSSSKPKRTSAKTSARPLNSMTQSDKPSDPNDNPWLSVPKRSSSKHSTSPDAVIISANPEFPSHASKPKLAYLQPQSKSKGAEAKYPATLPIAPDVDSDSGASFADFSPPSPNPLTTNQALIRQAFASDSVLASNTFAAEKSALAAEQEPDTASSNVLPGWGSWVGNGISTKSQRRAASAKPYLSADKGRALDETASTKRLRSAEKVIISEKRVPKTAVYLATQLPHPFETREQYERSLRLPVGPEWTTKETFQRQTKPRVTFKGGVIAPMRKPAL